MARLPLPAIFVWTSLGAVAGWWLHDFYDHPVDRPADTLAVQAGVDTSAAAQGDERNSTKEISSLLERGNYQSALLRLSETIHLDETEARKNQITFISSLAKLSSEEPEKAQPILRQFLQSDAYNPRALFLLGSAYAGTGQPMKALETLFDLKRLSQAEVPMEDIDTLIGKVESAYAKQLKDNEQLGELLQLYEFLTRNDPDNIAGFYKLAEIQHRLHHYYDALSSLDYVLYDPSWGKLAQSMTEKIQKSIELEDDIQIPLQRSGNHFIVTARINGIDGARLMIDTGASLCVLRPQAAQQFGLPTESDDHITLSMTSSIFNTPRIEIDSMRIGDVELRNVKAALVEMPPGIDTDGLLGMNFLGEFNFFIDQAEEMLYLSER